MFWISFRLQEKVRDTDFETGGSRKRIKMAAKKSFEEGEEMMEKMAESVATIMDHAVYKAKDKVEHKLYHGHGNNADEL